MAGFERIYSNKHLVLQVFALFCFASLKQKQQKLGSRLFGLDTQKPLQASKGMSPQYYTNKYSVLQREHEQNAKQC